ncbi:MAG: type IV pilus assembly protein PilM [Candidatus Azambacteria bacterium]|nr:type IV pilus assembly protein PilM [Candidatus Azambacteria bacterium]
MASPFNVFGIKSKSNNYLGVDIGTLSIKIVEISNEGGRPKLENYAVLTNYDLMLEDLSNETTSGKQKIFGGKAVLMLKRLLEAGEAKSREVNMSVPIFSSFLTVMELPQMSESEIANAIPFEAKKYIPVPLDNVVIDWSLIGVSDDKKSLVLLVAIPKDLISEYVNIAKETGLKLSTLELETVSAARALIGNDPVPTVLMDVGSRDTTISVVDGGFLRISHSIETSGEDLTQALAKGLNINWRRAEDIKKENGLKIMDNNSQITSILSPLLDNIINATQKIIDTHFSKTKKKVEKLVIYGGVSKMPGFADYFHERLKLDTIIGNPFSRISYPEKLKPAIDEIGHEFTIALGLALKSMQ